MKPLSVPRTQTGAKFEDVLESRLQKQERWVSKFQSIPLIDQDSKTYKELCDGLIP